MELLQMDESKSRNLRLGRKLLNDMIRRADQEDAVAKQKEPTNSPGSSYYCFHLRLLYDLVFSDEHNRENRADGNICELGNPTNK